MADPEEELQKNQATLQNIRDALAGLGKAPLGFGRLATGISTSLERVAKTSIDRYIGHEVGDSEIVHFLTESWPHFSKTLQAYHQEALGSLQPSTDETAAKVALGLAPSWIDPWQVFDPGVQELLARPENQRLTALYLRETDPLSLLPYFMETNPKKHSGFFSKAKDVLGDTLGRPVGWFFDTVMVGPSRWAEAQLGSHTEMGNLDPALRKVALSHTYELYLDPFDQNKAYRSRFRTKVRQLEASGLSGDQQAVELSRWFDSPEGRPTGWSIAADLVGGLVVDPWNLTFLIGPVAKIVTGTPKGAVAAAKISAAGRVIRRVPRLLGPGLAATREEAGLKGFQLVKETLMADEMIYRGRIFAAPRGPTSFLFEKLPGHQAANVRRKVVSAIGRGEDVLENIRALSTPETAAARFGKAFVQDPDIAQFFHLTKGKKTILEQMLGIKGGRLYAEALEKASPAARDVALIKHAANLITATVDDLQRAFLQIPKSMNWWFPTLATQKMIMGMFTLSRPAFVTLNLANNFFTFAWHTMNHPLDATTTFFRSSMTEFSGRYSMAWNNVLKATDFRPQAFEDAIVATSSDIDVLDWARKAVRGGKPVDPLYLIKAAQKMVDLPAKAHRRFAIGSVLAWPVSVAGRVDRMTRRAAGIMALKQQLHMATAPEYVFKGLLPDIGGFLQKNGYDIGTARQLEHRIASELKVAASKGIPIFRAEEAQKVMYRVFDEVGLGKPGSGLSGMDLFLRWAAGRGMAPEQAWIYAKDFETEVAAVDQVLATLRADEELRLRSQAVADFPIVDRLTTLDRTDQAASFHGGATINMDAIADMMRVQGEEGGIRAVAGMDPRILKTLAGNLYSGDLGQIAVKEMLQNAVDAVRPLKAAGRVTVQWDPARRAIMVVDNGVGMLPEVATKELVDIGGSLKHAGDSGGFGIAKVAIFSNAEHIEVVTTAKRGRKFLTTRLIGSGDDWLNPEVGLKVDQLVHKGAAETGTTVSITLKSDVRTTGWAVERWLENFLEHKRLPGELQILKATGVAEEPFRAMKIAPAELTSLASRDIEGASLEFFTAGPDKRRTWMQLYVLNEGLPQFSKTVYFPRDYHLPEYLVLDVHPKGAPDVPNYPFRPDREGLRKEAQDAVDVFVETSLTKEAAGQEAAVFRAAFTDAPTLKSGGQVIDTTGQLPQGFVTRLAQEDYMDNLAQVCREVSRAFDGVMGRVAAAPRAGAFFGMGLGDDYLAINVRLGELLGGEQGDALLINPFTLLREAEHAVTDGRITQEMLPDYLAGSITGTLLHENAHRLSGGHTEDFAASLTRLLSQSTEQLAEGQTRVRIAIQDIMDSGQFERWTNDAAAWRSAVGRLDDPTANIVGRASDSFAGPPRRGRGAGVPPPPEGRGPGPGEGVPGVPGKPPEVPPEVAPGAVLGEGRALSPDEEEEMARLLALQAKGQLNESGGRVLDDLVRRQGAAYGARAAPPVPPKAPPPAPPVVPSPEEIPRGPLSQSQRQALWDSVAERVYNFDFQAAKATYTDPVVRATGGATQSARLIQEAIDGAFLDHVYHLDRFLSTKIPGRFLLRSRRDFYKAADGVLVDLVQRQNEIRGVALQARIDGQDVTKATRSLWEGYYKEAKAKWDGVYNEVRSQVAARTKKAVPEIDNWYRTLTDHLDAEWEIVRRALADGSDRAWGRGQLAIRRQYQEVARENAQVFGWDFVSPTRNWNYNRPTAAFTMEVDDLVRFSRLESEKALRTGAGLPRPSKDVAAGILQLGDEIGGRARDVQQIVHSQAMALTDFVMLNYNNQFGIDSILQMFFPYAFFPTRTAAHWGMRFARNPAYGAALTKAILKPGEYAEHYGMPERLKYKIPIMVPFLTDFLAQFPVIGDQIQTEGWGPLYWIDPLQILFPMTQYRQQFADDQKEGTPFGTMLDWMEEETPLSLSPFAKIVGSEVGFLDRDAWTFGLFRGGPFGVPLGIAGRIATNWLQTGDDTNMPENEKRSYTNNGSFSSGFLQRIFSISPDRWDDYRTERALWGLVASDDLIPGADHQEQAQAAWVAMERGSGPIWAKAQRTSRSEQFLSDLTGWAFARITPVQEGELRIRSALRVAYQEAARQGKLQEFYERFPEYEGYTIAVKGIDDPVEREKAISTTLYYQAIEKYVESPYTGEIQRLQDLLDGLAGAEQTEPIRDQIRVIKVALQSIRGEQSATRRMLDNAFKDRETEYSLFRDPQDRALSAVQGLYYDIPEMLGEGDTFTDEEIAGLRDALVRALGGDESRWESLRRELLLHNEAVPDVPFDKIETARELLLRQFPPLDETMSEQDWHELSVESLRVKFGYNAQISAASASGDFGRMDELMQARDASLTQLHTLARSRVTRADAEAWISRNQRNKTPEEKIFEEAESVFDLWMSLVGDSSPLTNRQQAAVSAYFRQHPLIQKYYQTSALDVQNLTVTQVAALIRRREIWRTYYDLEDVDAQLDYIKSVAQELNAINGSLGLPPLHIIDPRPLPYDIAGTEEDGALDFSQGQAAAAEVRQKAEAEGLSEEEIAAILAELSGEEAGPSLTDDEITRIVQAVESRGY